MFLSYLVPSIGLQILFCLLVLEAEIEVFINTTQRMSASVQASAGLLSSEGPHRRELSSAQGLSMYISCFSWWV